MTSIQRLVLLASVALVAQGCADGGGGGSSNKPGAVSRDDLGKAWPLTVDAGVLECSGASEVTFTANGTTYAVNGMAQGADIEPIWADAPRGLKKNIGPLIQRGLKLCDS